MPTSEVTTPPLPPPPLLLIPFNLLLQNPLTAPATVILFAESPNQSNKDGPLPASKKSIEDMPTVKITESDLLGSELCAICLREYDVGGEAKEMPCKHRYHSGCIEKWLGVHGSCPVCRYEMPTEEEGDWDGKVREEENRGRRVVEIRMSIFFDSRRGSGDDDSGRSDGAEGQDMEVD